MSDRTGQAPLGNLLELTVTELSAAIKRTVEDTFGHVRVRGEVGRVSRPGSGHLYLDLKDDKSVLSGVIWKGVVPGLKIKPEQGLEVIVTGRLTTFPGQSRYQIIIEQMEPAGVGALMALLEERKKKLAAEGLFAAERKKPLPFLPEVIGVVTSPSGAVIRDILHRLNDRFPRHVLIWPVRVQGEQSAAEVAAGIEGFNKLPKDGPVPRPDVIIVARGGGSIEDLWSFNEEIVVRAAAASEIPLISAVGHETDTTLIDYAADRRAPTPTAAAEMAVPVRAELQAQVMERAGRLFRAETRILEQGRTRLEGLARGLPRASDLFALPAQRLDHAGERLTRSLMSAAAAKEAQLHRIEGRLNARLLAMRISQGEARTADMGERLARAQKRALGDLAARLQQSERLLESFSYKNVLGRGFALVRDGEGKPVHASAGLSAGEALEIEFAKEDRLTVTVSSGGAPKPAQKKTPGPSAKGQPKQGTLL
ncbi:exodeoxyribonuclease VII large subunit [Tepidicaulis sp. LMO-SS28]|uniref:exodeoxyribonuclease VII large subunit n=1 Tax=Tepidicaulis sp. LMO-SS28 TaxID=3447455 RepID=UPI003EDF562A